MGLFDGLFGGLFGGGNSPGSGFGNGFIGGATGGAPNPFGGSPFGGGLFSPPMPWGPQPTPPGFPPNPFGDWPFQQPPQAPPQQGVGITPIHDPWIGPGPTPINPPQAQNRNFASAGQVMPFSPGQASTPGSQMGPGHPPWLGRWSVPGTQMEGVAPQQNPMGATRMSGGVGTGPFGQRQQQNNGGGMGWQNIPLPAANVPQPPPNPWSTRRG